MKSGLEFAIPDRRPAVTRDRSPGAARPDTPAPDEWERFEALMADLSGAFVNLPADQVDARIDEALRQVVEFLGVDRGSLVEISAADGALWFKHSYGVPGAPAYPTTLVDQQLPWFAAAIRRGELLRLANLPDDLPPEAVREREYCQRVGLKSQLTVPLMVGGSVMFAIGCGTFRYHRAWPEGLVQRLRLLGEIFANALARRRAGEELGRRDRRYGELVESTRAVPWEADPHTLETTWISPEVVATFGYPHQAWYRDGFWASRLHPDDRGAVLRAVGEAVRGGRDRELEYRLVASDGRTVWVHDVITVRSEGGVPTAVRGVMIDVTARKGAETEAARLRDQLARASRVTTLGELAAAIAHEVNQPLCAILSNAETAQGYLAGGDAETGEVRDALQDIVADGRRAGEIIRRIRTLFRTRKTERAPFDLNDAAREVAAFVRHQLSRESIVLTLDFAADLPPVVGDRVQVQQVVLNLVLNAAEAIGGGVTAGGSPDRRRVSIATARTGDAVTVSVRDSGPGVNPDVLDRVFDAFFTTKADGTGIGLSISRTIVEAHGGRIRVEPARGGAPGGAGSGAAFHFTLPLTTGPSP